MLNSDLSRFLAITNVVINLDENLNLKYSERKHLSLLNDFLPFNPTTSVALKKRFTKYPRQRRTDFLNLRILFQLGSF